MCRSLIELKGGCIEKYHGDKSHRSFINELFPRCNHLVSQDISGMDYLALGGNHDRRDEW